MNISVRGFEGTMARISELQSKLGMETPTPQGSPPPIASQFEPTLNGLLGGGKSGDVAPLDPIGGGATVNGINAPDDIKAMIHSAATEAGIDPVLFDALIGQESSYNPSATSSAGAQGLAQLMPKTAASLGVMNPFDPAENLRGGAKYLAQMMKQFNGDVRLALAAYNAGPGAVKRAGGVPPIAETQHYVKTIMSKAGIR